MHFISIKENIDTSTPAGKFMLTVFAALCEFEREMIKQRQREGIDIALTKGKKFGRAKVTSPKFGDAYTRWRAGELTAVAAMKICGLNRATWYRRVKEHEEQLNQG